MASINKGSRTMHLNIDADLKPRLVDFAEHRGQTLTYCVNLAIRNLLSSEETDPTRRAALKLVLERKFAIPKNFTPLSFYNCLYLNAVNYPLMSCRNYWKDLVYLSSLDRSHKDIFTEVQEELKRELARGEDKKA